MVRRTLLGALALFPLPLIVLLKDMGPLPGDSLRHTIWRKGSRIVVDVTGQPLRPEDMQVGSLVSASPADLNAIQEADGDQNARAKASIILVRMKPGDIVSEQGDGWSWNGILAFSKICTHVGCPIALYQQRTHHLLCPCHQSTFDLADSGKVVFGPAARAMPQLPITVDSEGYLVAQSDFQQPVGPSFWERA
jgi:ubiquinol-cytochrome c reductase iron-sulfur subunit